MKNTTERINLMKTDLIFYLSKQGEDYFKKYLGHSYKKRKKAIQHFNDARYHHQRS